MFMQDRLAIPFVCLALFLSGCAQYAPATAVPVALYEKVGE